MQKDKAIELANAAAPFHPDVKEFFVTDDEQVFTNANDAVENAVKLCPGNPEVISLKVEELEFTAAVTVDELDNEKLTQLKIDAIDAAELKVNNLKAEISNFENDDDIDLDNTAQKLLVANLKEQLETAELELEALQPE